ncbi:MAG: hypothetical protein C0509_04550, partial [Acinetobacter sp.]|nr:hypothetical protein [Acinetobacter sp.]
MKHINKRWLSLAIAPLLFALLGIASQAQATTYTSCSSVPVSVPGDADISDSGACVISHSVTANGGHISITAPSVTVQDLTADYDITVTTAGNITVAGGITTGFGQVNLQGDNVNISGAVNATYDVTVMATGDIDLHNVSSAYRVHLETADDKDVTATGNLQAVYSYVYLKGDNLKVTGTVKALTNGNILMLAQHNLATGSVTGAPGGNIDFKANRSGSSSLFTIGGSGHTNGINGTVEAKGSGSSQIYASAIVMFTNGAGGIAISSTSDLIVTPASGGKTPNIFIDARDGVLSIPSGTISVDGSGTGLAGAIALAGQTINFGSNVVLSANQDQSAAGNNHWISLYAETINYQGSLTVSANGSGYDQYTRAGASVRSKGTFTVDDGEDPYYLPIWWNGTYPTSGNVSVNGAGSAPLSMTANGDNTSVSVAGDVLSFAGGNVSLTAKGNIRHEVFIEKQATLVGTSTGLTFGGTGAVTLDASGLADGDAGGWVSIYVDNASISGSAFTIHADAKGNANAGEVWFNPYNLAQLSSTVVNLTADGKGGLVSFQPNGGSGTASITGTTFSMSASGPTSGDGDAGTLYFGVSSLTLGGSTKGTLKGNGPATGTGNGATVTYYPGTTHAKLGTNNGDFQFSADS